MSIGKTVMSDDEYRDRYALDNWVVISAGNSHRSAMYIYVDDLKIEVDFLGDKGSAYTINFIYLDVKTLTWFWMLSTGTMTFFEVWQMPHSNVWVVPGTWVMNYNIDTMYVINDAPETGILHCFYWKDYHG